MSIYFDTREIEHTISNTGLNTVSVAKRGDYDQVAYLIGALNVLRSYRQIQCRQACLNIENETLYLL